METGTFHPGISQTRSGHISRSQRERQRNRLRRTRQTKNTTPLVALSSLRNAFPLSSNKTYDIVTTMTLGQFPRTSVSAVIHLQRIMTPPDKRSKTPKLFLWTPEQLKKLYDAFYENLRARWGFRRLWLIYQQKKLKSVNDGVDPITLESIQKKVSIVNLNTRSIYDFEAKSLAKAWTENLLYNDGLFHEPRYPTNPNTNLPFHILQIHYAIQAIRAYGQSNWVLESFADCQYNLMRWQKKFKSPLKIECLKRVFEDTKSWQCFETVLDFIEHQHEYHGIDFNQKFYKWLLLAPETSDFAKIWIDLCKRFYTETYTTLDKDEIETIEVRTSVSSASLMEIPMVVRLLYDQYIEKTNVRRGIVQYRLNTTRVVRYRTREG